MNASGNAAGSCSGISSMATRRLLAELTEAYQHQTGQVATVIAVGGVEALRRINDGESFDLVVLAGDAIDGLVESKRVDPGSRVDLVRSGIVVAVASGAPRPAIDNEAAVRDAVLRAKTVGYSTGPSGVYIKRLVERWGCTAPYGPRLVQAPSGIPVAALLARGEVELGFQQLSELMHEPGIDVVGPLPAEIQLMTVFAGAICTASEHAESARQFLAFLASPETAAVKVRHGMEAA